MRLYLYRAFALTGFPSAGKEGLDPKTKEGRAEIVKLYDTTIKSEYAQVARFKGATMSMSEKGQAKVYNEIHKRLDASNIDRVSEAMSSNDCEGFYNMLTKFSHGKRIYYGQTDSWEIFEMLVAGRKSNDRFEDEVHSLAGLTSMWVRDVRIETRLGIKDKKRASERTDKHKDRRKWRQVAKLKDSQKSKTLKGRHKPDSLSPKDNCKSAAEKPPPKKKRKTRCKNCKALHHGKCPWPVGVDPQSVKPKTKKQLKEEQEQQEMKERMMSIAHLID